MQAKLEKWPPICAKCSFLTANYMEFNFHSRLIRRRRERYAAEQYDAREAQPFLGSRKEPKKMWKMLKNHKQNNGDLMLERKMERARKKREKTKKMWQKIIRR